MKSLLLSLLIALLSCTSIDADVDDFAFPLLNDYTCSESKDGYINVCTSPLAAIGSPDIERYSKVYSFLDEYFNTIRREDAKLYVIYQDIKTFINSLGSKYPSAAQAFSNGAVVIRAYTYISKKDDKLVIVIESYQQMNDNMLIHELIHHYLESLTADGVLNNHEVIEPFTTHLEWLFASKHIGNI